MILNQKGGEAYASPLYFLSNYLPIKRIYFLLTRLIISQIFCKI